MSLYFSGREEEQISSALPVACYPTQLERQRDTKEQPPCLKLKLVLQLVLGLSWVAGGIPACSGEARAGFPTAGSLCECLEALRSHPWLMLGFSWGGECWGEISLPPWTKHLFMPGLYVSGECSHICLGLTCRISPVPRELPSVGLLLRLKLCGFGMPVLGLVGASGEIQDGLFISIVTG